jgi:hypothetical protein
MIDRRAINGKCNQSVDVHCQKTSLSLLLICLFLFRFGEALKKMVPPMATAMAGALPTINNQLKAAAAMATETAMSSTIET